MADSTQPTPPSKALVFARRTGSTLFLWALVSGVFLSRASWAYIALISLLTLIATWEYFQMLRHAGVSTHRNFGVLLAIGYSATIAWHLLHGMAVDPSLDILAVCTVTIGAFILQLGRPIQGVQSLLSVASTVLGFIYIPVLFGFVGRLLFLPTDSQTAAGTLGSAGPLLLIWLLAVTKFTDMGAYLTGSLIGKHKMIPHVSPAKTWEGFVGALAFSQLAGIGLFLLFPGPLAILHNLTHVIVLGVILSLLAVVGDLAESIVKRALDAKDSGRMLPGIGGSLDLIDSICFTAPALYFYLKYLLLPIA